MSSTADIGADLHRTGLGVDLEGREVGAVRVGVDLRVEGGGGIQVRLDPVRPVVHLQRGEGDLGQRLALIGALDLEAAGRVLEIVLVRLQHVRRDRPGLLDHLVSGPEHCGAPDDQRPGAVGVEPALRDLGVPVQHFHVLEGHPQLVGHDLAPGRLVSLPVGAGAGHHLDPAQREHPDLGMLPAAGDVVVLAEDPRRGQPAHARCRWRCRSRAAPGPCGPRRSACSARSPS